jgi:hypothetical protein
MAAATARDNPEVTREEWDGMIADIMRLAFDDSARPD